MSGMITQAQDDELAAELRMRRSRARAAIAVVHTTDLLHRGAQASTCLDCGRRSSATTRAARPTCCTAAACSIYTTFDPTLQALAEQARTSTAARTPRASTRAIVSLDTTDRGDPGHGRRQRLQAACRRGQHGARAAPDRLEHQALHPRRGAAGRRAAERRDRRHQAVHAAQPRRPEGPVRDHRRGRAATSSRSQSRPWRSINCAFAAPVPDRRAAPRRRHDVPHGPVAVPVPRPGRQQAARRSSRTPASPPGANEMAPLDMAAGMQTIANQGLHMTRTTSSRSTRPTARCFYTHQDPGRPGARSRRRAHRRRRLKGVLTGARPAGAADVRPSRRPARRAPRRTTPTPGSSVHPAPDDGGVGRRPELVQAR